MKKLFILLICGICFMSVAGTVQASGEVKSVPKYSDIDAPPPSGTSPDSEPPQGTSPNATAPSGTSPDSPAPTGSSPDSSSSSEVDVPMAVNSSK